MISLIFVALVGALIYRLRGMGLWPSRPWWQILFALPYGIVAGSFCGLGAGVFVLAVTACAVLTGHASLIDLGTVRPGAANAPADGQRNEWYSGWIPGSGYWHDFAGLMVSGLLISAPCGLALIWVGEWHTGLAIIAGGFLKAPAYALGWIMADRSHVPAIPAGEFLTGFFLWGALALVIQVIT